MRSAQKIDSFKQNAYIWVKDAYESAEYLTGEHRVRIVGNILSKYKPKKVMDVCCGAGQLIKRLEKQGHNVVGIDNNPDMIAMCKKNKVKASRINFQDVRGKYDVMTALGCIYYFTDKFFFTNVKRILKPNGMLIVSAKNNLFNVMSLKEVNPRLAKEIRYWCSKMPRQKEKKVPYSNIKRRQHTPLGLIKEAKKYGFRCKGLYGVHPHAHLPCVKKVMPRYNELSHRLHRLENLPVSLVWSSQFIAVFKK